MPIEFRIEVQRDANKASYRVLCRCDTTREMGPYTIPMPPFVPLGRRLRDSGRDYYNWLFPEHSDKSLQQAKAIARKDNAWLRILVSYTPSAELHGLPWESLHDGEEYLAVGDHSTLARYLYQERPVKPLAIKPPLLMLVTTGDPGPLAKLNLDTEIDELGAIFEQYSRSTVRRGRYQVRKGVKIEHLSQAFGTAGLEQRQYHIWHHAGYGGNRDGIYRLHFGEKSVSTDTLVKVLPVEDLRFVFLNVCSGAEPVGLSTMLAELNVPAALGFTSLINDDHAIKFAAVLYRNLLLQQAPLDWAVHQARRSLMGTGDDILATAVLFLRTTSTTLFQSRQVGSKIRRPGDMYTDDRHHPISQCDFDVFLCHNSEDKDIIRTIGTQLKNAGLRPWLDEWELRPGLPWQPLLEKQIEQIHSAAVFVGPSGIGPWQRQELDAYLLEFVRRGSPVIPVILPGVTEKPCLPIFLKNFTWVDFRNHEEDPLGCLIWGITGDKRSKR